MDPSIIREFKGTHPAAVRDWLPPAVGVFPVNPNHPLTKKDKKRRVVATLERLLRVDLSKRHFRMR